jgi:hypothetical protein
MSNPRIEVDVVANVAGVATGVSAATSQLDKLGKAAQSTEPKIESLGKATSRYNGIGIDFARVIQDAPFGIIGVGNNIQQLAQSYSALGNVGDSTSKKLKLAFTSIFSTGNLLVLGVSAITTALTFYEKGAFQSEDATKTLNDSLEKYRENLQGIAKASLEGIKNAQTEIGNFKLLQAQAENTNISFEKRIEAVEKLKKQYPDYLKNLTNEQILTGNVGTAYENLTASLIATAKAKAFQGQIGENALNQATLAAQSEENLLKIKELQIQRADVLAASEKQSARDKQDFLTKASALQSNINALEDQNKKNKAEISKLDAANLKLAGEINQKVSEGADFQKNTGKEIDANKEKLKKYSQGWDEYNLQQETAKELQDKLTFGIEDYEKAIINAFTTTQNYPVVPEVTGDNVWDQYAFSVFQYQQAAAQAGTEVKKTASDALELGKKINSIQGKDIKIKLDVEGFGDEMAGPSPFDVFLDSVALQLDRLPELEQRVADFAKTINDLITGNVTDAFIDLGYTIGETLASGGNVLKAIGGSLLKSFSRFLGQFGEQLIAYGVAASAFGKVSIALATPGAAIIAAPLAIAAGIALTAIAGAIGSMGKRGPGGGGGGSGAGGGSSAQGTSFTGGAQGGLFAQDRGLSGELVVRGQDLVYVFSQANDRINKG